MGRGRPKKVVTASTVDLFSDKELQSKNYYKCDVCGNYVRVSLIPINLSYFLGKAAYRRKCSADRIKLCDKCADDLSSVVDGWIISKNPRLEKFK